MAFAAVGFMSVMRRIPKIAPRNVTSSMSAVTTLLTSAPGIRPGVREADPVIAVGGDPQRQARPDDRVEEAVEDRLAAIARSEEELVARGRVDEEDPGDEREPEPVPGQRRRKGGGRPSVASSYSAALNRSASSRSITSRSARPAAISRCRVGSQSSTAATPRPSEASRGMPPAGSRPTRPASSAACLPSASRAASACA